ncbi:MAG TPA: hypothetical protein VN691_06180 [Steroidobacteraceae bacterium]|nr:hypothetical protein [Steroidobacteraceae bacterium]
MKASRLALLAAQLCCAALMSESALAGSASSVWSDLWRTPDQQGQALLDAGEPAQAAARFHDPRRRAYADLGAGRDAAAAKLLAPFTDTESEYNRGNALAKSGQLQEALAAYDAALKQAPADRDIRRNRDLVARALEQQRQSPQSSGRRGQGRHGSGASGPQRQGAAGQRNGSGSQQQSGSGGQQSGGGAQGAPNGSRSGTGQSGQSGSAGEQPDSPQGEDRGSGTSKDSAGEAQRDAEFAAGLARRQGQRSGSQSASQAQGSQRNGASGSKGAATGLDSGLLEGGTRVPKQPPETERQLALDQWLRQIPDSPAGLLQRKFLIEHMMRQQDDGDAQGGAQ